MCFRKSFEQPDPGGRSEEIYFSHETKNDASDADDGMIVSVCFWSVFSNAATLGMPTRNINSTQKVNDGLRTSTLGERPLKKSTCSSSDSDARNLT